MQGVRCRGVGCREWGARALRLAETETDLVEGRELDTLRREVVQPSQRVGPDESGKEEHVDKDPDYTRAHTTHDGRG